MFTEQHLSEISCLTDNKEMLSGFWDIPVKPVFDERIMGFFHGLSKRIFADPHSKEYVDVLSYAYWIRKSSLEAVRKKYNGKRDFKNRMGRGTAFHVAPSNVPINFAVSFTSALLAGNICIVRISNREFPQVEIICDAIKALFREEYPDLKERLCIIRYPHNDEITELISARCDIRIIWGGNRTIQTIRRAQLPPRAIEMAFADRHSLALINGDEYMAMLQKDGGKCQRDIAEKFYTDTYYTDQNACSSPRMVVWFGSRIEEARESFWEALSQCVHEKYMLRPIQTIDKISLAYEFAACHPNTKIEKKDNYIVLIQPDRLDQKLMDYKGNSGSFFEYSAEDMEEILPLLGKSCQTISYLGMEKQLIANLVRKYGVKGVDRIVPMGSTMELSFTWDGYDMIEAMSRIVDIF